MTIDDYGRPEKIRRLSKITTLISATRQNKSRRAFIGTASSNLLIALSSTIGGIIAARLLGPSGRGELAAATAWAGILSVIATLGLPQAITFYTARNPAKLGDIFSASLFLLVIQGCAIVAGGWIAATIILGRFQPAALPSVQIYLLSVPFNLLITYLSTMAQGLNRFKLFNGLRVVSALGFPLVMIFGLLAGISDAKPIVTLMLVTQAATAFIGLVFFVARNRPKIRIRSTQIWELLRYGSKSYLGSLSWIANARLDQLIMSAFVGLGELGIYAVAVSYSTVLFPLSGAFAMVLFPRVAGEQREAAGKTIKRTLRANLIVSSIGALFLAFISPFLLPLLFGVEFSGAVLPSVILLAAIVLLGFNYVISDGLRGMGYPGSASAAELVGAMTTVIGLFLLLPLFGIFGAALTSLVSYGIVALLLYLAFRRYSRLQKTYLVQ